MTVDIGRGLYSVDSPLVMPCNQDNTVDWSSESYFLCFRRVRLCEVALPSHP